MANYEERYCAFVDVLGFGGLISGLRDGTVAVEEISELLNVIHKPRANRFTKEPPPNVRAQSISDAVAMSAERNEEGLSSIFESLELLARALLLKGYFVRGALCRGRLYHDDRMIFGDALIEAFNLESQVANFPRILITRNVVEDARSYRRLYNFSDLLQQATDGPFYLHVLYIVTQTCRNLGELYQQGEAWDALASVHKMLQRRFDEAADNPRHFEKVQWFARYWNSSLDGKEFDELKVVGAGLQ